MNCERLYEIAEQLLVVESKYDIQSSLQQLLNDMQQLASNPNQPQFQTQYASRFQEFQAAWKRMESSFDPQKQTLLREIGAAPFFLDDVPGEIDLTARENPHTPTVTQQKIQSILTARENYLADIREIRDRLKKVGIQPYKLEPNSAEIGLLIPRGLFHSMFDELIKELGTINRIIRTFSEVATGSGEPVEVHQISTSDPIFFLGLSAETASLMGHALTWAIATWASVEGIRKLRSETQKNKSFTEAEIKTFFESKVESTIEAAIEQKVIDMLGPPKKEAGRSKEQRTDLAWALESILTRVERGMTMELRFLPPAQEENAESTAVPEPKVFQELREIVPQLSFSASDPSPILQLPPPEPPRPAK
jgi:hypothetical protein